MHHKRFIIMGIVFFSVFAMFADNARFNILVLDSVTDKPIQGVCVRGTFESRYPRWKDATKFSDFCVTTGLDGYLSFRGDTNCGEAGFRIDKTDSHYGAPWIDIPFKDRGKLPFSWWQPDNLVVTIKLQRVEHPIPLFVKQIFSRASDSVSSNYFDICKGKMQFDMLKGSFLPPIGKGEHADICFTRLEREDLGIGTTFRGSITAPAYKDSMSIRFTGEDNGLVEVPSEKTAGIKIRTASEDGYKPDYLVTKGRDKNVKYFSSSNPDRNFAFRIRTKKDKNGKIVSAYYGKIYGDIEIKKPYTVEVSVAAPSFMYYLNPTPLDRNLEWDVKTNLCPNPGSLVQKQP